MKKEAKHYLPFDSTIDLILKIRRILDAVKTDHVYNKAYLKQYNIKCEAFPEGGFIIDTNGLDKLQMRALKRMSNLTDKALNEMGVVDTLVKQDINSKDK